MENLIVYAALESLFLQIITVCVKQNLIGMLFLLSYKISVNANHEINYDSKRIFKTMNHVLMRILKLLHLIGITNKIHRNNLKRHRYIN